MEKRNKAIKDGAPQSFARVLSPTGDVASGQIEEGANDGKETSDDDSSS